MTTDNESVNRGMCTGEWPKNGLGIPVAFEMVSKPHETDAIADKRNWREPRLANSDAAIDGGCHGESDRILHSGFCPEKSYVRRPQSTWEGD